MARVANKTPPFRSHMDVENETELKYWTKHLGVTRDALLSVVDKVGNSAAAVRKELETIQDRK
jgi:Protein of unknown function (DUF3606)